MCQIVTCDLKLGVSDVSLLVYVLLTYNLKWGTVTSLYVLVTYDLKLGDSDVSLLVYVLLIYDLKSGVSDVLLLVYGLREEEFWWTIPNNVISAVFQTDLMAFSPIYSFASE